MLIRHLVAILLLPIVVTVVVPTLLLNAAGDSGWQGGPLLWVLRGAGGLLMAAGIALFVWCVALFGRIGRGTLAPWDPTQRLVAVGPYRITRNPMITGVALVLAGETLWWASWGLAGWTAAFVLINQVYFLLVEEPGLRRRFGDEYRAYAARVPRWLPRGLGSRRVR